jgi:hypothetical protein
MIMAGGTPHTFGRPTNRQNYIREARQVQDDWIIVALGSPEPTVPTQIELADIPAVRGTGVSPGVRIMVPLARARLTEIRIPPSLHQAVSSVGPAFYSPEYGYFHALISSKSLDVLSR